MKKIVALVLALSQMATTVFAEPVGIASENLQTTGTVSEVKEAADSLFADVSASQLDTSEAKDVEGGCIFVVVALSVFASTLCTGIAVARRFWSW
jgi:hypothetical protein